jgi:hypothetical protein
VGRFAFMVALIDLLEFMTTRCVAACCGAG